MVPRQGHSCHRRGERRRRTGNKLDAPPVSSRRKRWKWQQLVFEMLPTSTHQLLFHSQPVWLQLGTSGGQWSFHHLLHQATACYAYAKTWPSSPHFFLNLHNSWTLVNGQCPCNSKTIIPTIEPDQYKIFQYVGWCHYLCYRSLGLMTKYKKRD